MKQSAFTIAVEPRAEMLDSLKAYLQLIGDDIRDNGIIDFSEYTTLHYCCFVVLEDQQDAVEGTEDEPGKPLLMFEGNIDGSVPDFLRQMSQQDSDFLHEVYRHCHGYPESSDSDALVRYMLQHDVGANAFYVGHPGRDLGAVRDEQKLYRYIEAFLDKERAKLEGKSDEQVGELIQKHVKQERDLDFANKPLRVPFLARFGSILFSGLIVLLVLLLAALIAAAFGHLESELLQSTACGIFVLVALYIIWLLIIEKRDVEDTTGWRPGHISELQLHEDRQPQNHLMSMTYVKGGWLRLLTLRVVLFAVNIVARLSATKGELSGIVTIHFARWVIVGGGPGGRKRLLFFSNYDGSWENYLGEFIDQASVGLTGIWSNTELGKDRGFPTSKLLVFGGSRNEQKFKAYARNSQHTELVWYSACLDLSVKNIGNNKEIRDRLYSNPEFITEWLRRF